MTPRRRDQLIVAGILVLAVILRFANLPGRGEWDDDQGKELLDVMAWVRDGHIPLLGPMSSVGNVHHGVVFYLLLAPGAFLTDNNPVAALAVLALIGVGGVAATWWLGRTVGGPLAGHVAGLLMAVSPSAIDASTFVWNPNIVAPGAAVAVAAGWHAWRTHRARWWMASAAGALLMVNGHLLAFVVGPPLLALLIADVLRRSGPERRAMIGPICGAAGIFALGFVPLLIHELLNDYSETRAVLAFVSGEVQQGGIPAPTGLPIANLPVIGWRVLVWPMSGSLLTAPLWGIPAAVIAIAALTISSLGPAGLARQYGRWAAATTAWAVLALTLIAPTLAVLAVGLPNDQYHTWLDPILFAAVGVAFARVAGSEGLRLRIVALAAVVGCVMLSLTSMPPLRSANGGWPTAEASAAKIHALAGDRSIAVTGIVKTGEALAFPLRLQNAPMADPSDADILVVVCDPLLEQALGIPCDGKAEDGKAARIGFPVRRLLDRFSDGPRRLISVYERS